MCERQPIGGLEVDRHAENFRTPVDVSSPERLGRARARWGSIGMCGRAGYGFLSNLEWWSPRGQASRLVVIAQAHQERARRRRRLSSGAPVSAHLSSSARRTEARPVGYRSLASERCFRAASRRRTTLRSPNSRLGRGNVDRHRDRGNDDEIVHALAVHRAECADDQLCERGQERTRQEQPKSRSAPPRRPRTGPRKLEAKSRILFELPHAERFSNVGQVSTGLGQVGSVRYGQVR